MYKVGNTVNYLCCPHFSNLEMTDGVVGVILLPILVKGSYGTNGGYGVEGDM